MPLQGKWAILYYGVFASVTGGWLPVRTKNLGLTLFHLAIFLAFVFLPFSVFHIRVAHWSGWFTYSVIVVTTFLILKVVNTRLHQSLGNDPIPEEEPEQEDTPSDLGALEGEEEGRETAAGGDSKEKQDPKDSDDSEEDGDAVVPPAEAQVTVMLSQEESVQRHRDSVSTLGMTSSGVSGASRVSHASHASHIVEMQQRESPSLAPSTVVTSGAAAAATSTDTSAAMTPAAAHQKSVESIDSDSQLANGRSGTSLKPVDPASVLALMSPVHRSSSNVDAASNIAIAASVMAQEGFSEGDEDLDDTGIQRSASMPPAMFDDDDSNRATRNRERSGICIQRRGSRHRQRIVLESRSEDELTTSGGGGKDGDSQEWDGSKGEDVGTESYPRGRRNAFRGGLRVVRRATCAADGSYNTSRNTGTERPDTPIASPVAPMFVSMVPVMEEQVQSKLELDGHLHLMEAAHLMPKGLQEAILADMVPISWFVLMRERAGELRRGHLATEESDSSPGAIHWFEVDGEWDFYMFQPEEPNLDESLLDDASLPIEDLLAYSRLMSSNYPSLPPRPPPRLHNASSSDGEPAGEEEKKPTYRVIPFVKKSEVTINFPRKLLEEFMDRNVTWAEVIFTIFLAMLVCVIAALLLSIVDFYSGFWVFWFCFVVGTAQFSLLKSVQDDPASPTPGQNNIMALGRAVYFIFFGVLALCIDAALRHIDHFDPLFVYGFNVNNPSVLLFVRNTLLILILCFPILFALGWMPQADTFAIYFMEQIDMHIFGGTASTGLLCSFYAILRSVSAVAVLWGLGYAGFSQLDLQGLKGDESSPSDPEGLCEFENRLALSFFIGALYAVSFVLSRSTTNHQYLWELIQRGCRKFKRACRCMQSGSTPAREEGGQPTSDPLEDMYCDTLKKRLISDVIISVFIFLLVSAVFLSTAFCRSVIPAYVIYGLTCVMGIVNHYFIPHLKKEMPWLCFGEPLLKAREWHVFEVIVAPKLSRMEQVLQLLLFIEKNLLYPLTFLFAFGLSAHHYKALFGNFGAALVLTVVGMKILRTAWTDIPRQYLILIFTLFFFNYDYAHLSEGLPFDYFIIAILFVKFYDLFLKMQFIFIYIAPWQSSWSSAGHIIIQPLLIPHTPLIFLQTVISAIVSAPMNPVYASTMFMLSYARPVKYWEKDYNTKRADSSNTRLETQLEGTMRNPNPDRLDSLFYEHLTWVLQKDLCGDLVLGRWGRVASGDFFILTSDRLNALVHIIEYGNGFVTFQLRGLEFRGTYCHQREVEAITESVADDEGCLWHEPGHLPFMLSCNKVFGSRGLAWEVVSSCYTLHGYSISENQAHLIFNSFDYRRGFVTYYIKSIIYKLSRWPRLKTLLNNPELELMLQEQMAPSYCDKDALFDEPRNSDYSHRHGGVLKERFTSVFQPFVQVCVEREGLEVDCGEDSFMLTLSFAFTVLGRRMFYQHAQHGAGRRSGDNFMNGLYRMFLGDARPNHPNDEWVFQDVDSIKDVIIPATRLSLKVHQDNFSFSEEYDSPNGVYEAIKEVDDNHVVTHENDHNWRTAVVTNQPSLLALRYQRTEESYIYPYKLIRLTSKFIKFRVIKMNRECVRSLWTSQQHELIFLRNSDSERGSIQNHKPTLRNMVNSSMDLPIGYPIYVSPLQTSFVDRHETFNDTVLSKVTSPLKILRYLGALKGACKKCKISCAKKVNSRSGSFTASKGEVAQTASTNDPVAVEGSAQRRGSVDSLTGFQYDVTKPYKDPFPQSDSDSEEQLWKPMWVSKQVVVTDISEIFDNFKMSWLKWRPEDEVLAHKAQKTHWKAWRPEEGMEGEVIHEWRPFHIDTVQRSHIDKVILLVKLTEDLYVLIKEQGVKEVHGHTV